MDATFLLLFCSLCDSGWEWMKEGPNLWLKFEFLQSLESQPYLSRMYTCWIWTCNQYFCIGFDPILLEAQPHLRHMHTSALEREHAINIFAFEEFFLSSGKLLTPPNRHTQARFLLSALQPRIDPWLFL